jgi:tetratricopeptide (TPR) repeat protein
VTLAAYQRVYRAGFVWDDNAHVTRAGLRSLHGLWRIWFEPGSTQQYYPVLHSAFWLEHRAWGDSATGYHLANVLLHALVACLLLRVLMRLAVPGAFLGAALFAVHPVAVESVAWISEQKNTLSAVFYLLAALAYLAFDRGRRPGTYAAATALFILALLSKSVTATLPAALLVVLWWQRGRLSARRDVIPLIPWLALAAGAAGMTSWMERTQIGASGAAYDLGAAGRLVLAGRAVWFYLWKLLWPLHLSFVYPRWTIEAGDPAQYIGLLAAAAVIVVLWTMRRRRRGPLAAALLFVGTLFPALGFINVYPFIYSFVADHFQYLADASTLGALAAALALGARRLPALGGWVAPAAGTALVALLAVLSWSQCAGYADLETLWRTTISRNPSAWMAHNNLASELLDKGQVEGAISEARTSLELMPRNAEAYVTLGDALGKEGHAREALAQYGRALEIDPGNAIVRNNLGNALLKAGRLEEAVEQYRRAIATKPDFAKAHANLGDALLRLGRPDEAIAEYLVALDNDPLEAGAEANLGTALAEKGRLDDAVAHFQRALAIDPRLAIAETNLGNVLLQAGRLDEAIAHYRKALEIDPRSSAIHNNLGFALRRAGRLDEAISHFRQAVELDPENAGARRNLDDALAGK